MAGGFSREGFEAQNLEFSKNLVSESNSINFELKDKAVNVFIFQKPDKFVRSNHIIHPQVPVYRTLSLDHIRLKDGMGNLNVLNLNAEKATNTQGKTVNSGDTSDF